jgi:hypothetical protein
MSRFLSCNVIFPIFMYVHEVYVINMHYALYNYQILLREDQI